MHTNMAAVEQKKYYTEVEYLQMERAALLKSEYYKGEVFAMSGHREGIIL